MNVTVKPKCYRNWDWVFVCAGCGLLSSSERNDAMTCSPACRVRAHRSGYLKSIKADADALELKPAGLLHAQAINRLRPDLGDRIMAERGLKFEDIMPEVYRAFIKEVIADMKRHECNT